ncbi:MAG: site-specific DNA-methyltransferase [Gammaproteobacteria bacterium]|nr:site-specific DNA-methyltransferase [Gammaproteobacteria bacterium]
MSGILDMQSPDLVNQNIAKLAELFPNCVTESAKGKSIDFDLLKQELNHAVVEGSKERYRLEWPGKREAIVTANLPTTKTLRPMREDSVDFDNTENIYIEGDNLEVLKLLQESYLGKIKMIYIDPPYNTGNDFVYKDNFAKDKGEELFESGQKDELSRRLVVNPETSGRYHSNWLSMMYPRLKLARNLLKEDGVIFISIDDNEVHNLRKLTDEIFGEKNFVSEFIWEKKKKPSFLHKNIGKLGEYIVCYVKDHHTTFPFSLETTTAGKKYPFNNAGNSRAILTFPPYSVRFNMTDQVVHPQDMSQGNIVTILLDKLVIADGKNIGSFRLEGEWRYSQESLDEICKNKEEIVISKIPFRPNHRKHGGEIKKMKNFFSPSHYQMETNEDATTQLSELFGADVFSYPKPVKLIKTLVSASTYDDDNPIVLDFFSGSATTAHAILKQNSESLNGHRTKYILVQLPEDLDKNLEAVDVDTKRCIVEAIKILDQLGKSHYLTELSKERIRRSAKKIKAETGADIDYGFRVYRLDESNMRDVYYHPQDYDQSTIDLFADNVKSDRTEDDLLTQVMLSWGLPLSLKIERVKVAGKKVLKVAGNSLFACFDQNIDDVFAKEIAKDKPVRMVFRDAGFKDDTAKTNVKQWLKQLSPETEMKVL